MEQESIKKNLLNAIGTGAISNFPELFIAFVFAGGGATKPVMSTSVFLDCLHMLFSLAIEAREDEIALAILKKIFSGYRAVEEEIEKKKESRQKHFGDAVERADKKLFEFFTLAYYQISREMMGCGRPLMKKTRFQILESAAQYWTQEMTEESYAAFRFLIDILHPPEEKEILDKIFRPRVERWFTNVELIEKWITASKKDPIPYEIQQLLVMARAKNGGPALAKRDIANSRTLKPKFPLGPEDINDLIA